MGVSVVAVPCARATSCAAQATRCDGAVHPPTMKKKGHPQPWPSLLHTNQPLLPSARWATRCQDSRRLTLWLLPHSADRYGELATPCALALLGEREG